MVGQAYIMVNAVKYGNEEEWLNSEDSSIKFPVKFDSKPGIEWVTATPIAILTGISKGEHVTAKVKFRPEPRSGLSYQPINSFRF